MFGLGYGELMIVGLVAVLLFGSRLPGVARSLGKSFIEFKKGMRGFEDEIRGSVNDRPTVKRYEPEDKQIASAPRFEPPKEVPEAAASGVAGDDVRRPEGW
jgi:sec-independent protein translocase protein TatA